jgi:hypothetical protein
MHGHHDIKNKNAEETTKAEDATGKRKGGYNYA